MVSWDEVRTALETGTRFWIATTNPNGSPHLIQQWGAWIDDRFHFEGGSDTRWARNLAHNASVAMSCDKGDMAVMVYSHISAS